MGVSSPVHQILRFAQNDMERKAHNGISVAMTEGSCR